MKITNDIYYVGVNDHKVDLFEGMYVVPNGMSYNSYVVLDDKITVFDSVDAHFGDEWLANVERVLGGKTPDYLVVQHMEPDHSAGIAAFAVAATMYVATGLLIAWVGATLEKKWRILR